MRALLMLTALVIAAPAGAQLYGGITSRPNEPELRLPLALDTGVGDDLHDIRSQIKRARKSGDLTRSEARALRRDSDRIAAMQDRFARDGLSADESAELATRTDALRAQVDYRRNSGDGAK